MLSFIGSAIAIISLLFFILFFLVGVLFQDTSSYLGLFIYIILPVFLILGLILIPIGMTLEVKRRKKRELSYIEKGWPVIDLNISRYRNAILIFSVGTVFFVFLTALGSYEAFHYTESVEFCGTVCHEVMQPEHVAYNNSPHARVACVDCHVGSGANWYMRSKLSGLRQVYAVITNDFSRPIETPLHNLRPARETCEKCHWPEKFYARQLINEKHYLTDSLNTEWNIGLQMKTGPSHSAQGLSEGIHWHINPNIKIEYIPKRENRRDIPWVKYTNLETNEEIVYIDEDNMLSEKKMADAVSREMDCMDCHTRPSHHYSTPMEFVDDGITAGRIPKDLPYIKKVAMDLFIDPYDHTDTALMTIESTIHAFYKEEMPELYDARIEDIDKAIEGIIEGFSENIFPEMGVSWDAYTDHIGHKTYNGCFRCHDDNHVSESGNAIRKDCNICHTIILQGKSGEEMVVGLNDALDFVHPKELDEGWEEDLCYECHRYLY
jgi:nitrate/TMAO reductase-like tetraheme cytochrome c subunit